MKERKSKADEPEEFAKVFPEDTKIEPVRPVTEFTIKAGVNKYGFIHFPKKAITSLPFQPGEPLKAKIQGEDLIITKT